MKRPRLITKCVADHYADKTRERVAEFDGGLISLRRCDDGTLLVSLYQLDSNVVVRVDPARLAKEEA